MKPLMEAPQELVAALTRAAGSLQTSLEPSDACHSMTHHSPVCAWVRVVVLASESDEMSRRTRTYLASLLQAWSDGFRH